MRELVLAEIATIREGSDNFRGSRWTAISCVYHGGKNIDVQKLKFTQMVRLSILRTLGQDRGKKSEKETAIH